MNIIERAMRAAEDAHRGQTRKYTGVPYIVHPYSVAALVRTVTDDAEVVAAAFLHDTVEDTDMSLSFIAKRFSVRTSALVEMLTDVSRPSDGNRRVRKQLDLEHTARACAEAKTIKLADLIDNTASIVAFDPQFARVYMEEKARLLEVLKAGSPVLWKLANTLVAQYRVGV